MTNIKTSEENNSLVITIDNQKVSNAYDFQMAKDLAEAFKAANNIKNLKVVVLKSEGKNFCTGANLNWMLKSKTLTPEENLKDMGIIKEMFQAMTSVCVPIITYVQGKVFGGGLGLVAASDIVFCEEDAIFCLSEAKLGLIPGIITPLVVNKIGPSRFQELSLTAREFTARDCMSFGLIHHVGSKVELQKKLHDVIERIRANSLDSTKEIKRIMKKNYFNNEVMMADLLEISSAMRQGSGFQNRLKTS